MGTLGLYLETERQSQGAARPEWRVAELDGFYSTVARTAEIQQSAGIQARGLSVFTLASGQMNKRSSIQYFYIDLCLHSMASGFAMIFPLCFSFQNLVPLF